MCLPVVLLVLIIPNGIFGVYNSDRARNAKIKELRDVISNMTAESSAMASAVIMLQQEVDDLKQNNSILLHENTKLKDSLAFPPSSLADTQAATQMCDPLMAANMTAEIARLQEQLGQLYTFLWQWRNESQIDVTLRKEVQLREPAEMESAALTECRFSANETAELRASLNISRWKLQDCR